MLTVGAASPSGRIVVFSVAELLVVLGSVSFAFAYAVSLMTLPPVGNGVASSFGVTTILMVASPDAAIVLSLQTTVPSVSLHIPCVELTETTRVWGESELLNITPVARCGPLFVTVSV